jgi:hypothetical protein
MLNASKDRGRGLSGVVKGMFERPSLLYAVKISSQLPILAPRKVSSGPALEHLIV